MDSGLPHVDSRFPHVDSGFRPGDSGFLHVDSGFPHVDSGFHPGIPYSDLGIPDWNVDGLIFPNFEAWFIHVR